MKKFILILTGFVIANLVISFNYSRIYDAFSYTYLCYTANAFFVIFAAIGDFQNLFLSNKQFEFINSLPIEEVSIIRAKFKSAYLFLTVLILITLIPQAILFFFYDSVSAISGLRFIAGNLAFSTFAINLVIIAYILVVKFFYEKAFTLLYIIQFVFVGSVIYSTTMTTKQGSVQGATILNLEFTKYLPQYYFTGAVTSNSWLIISLGISLVSFPLLYLVYAKYFMDINLLFQKAGSNKPKNNKSVFPFNLRSGSYPKVFLKNDAQAASYVLKKRLVFSSKTLLLRILPATIIPVVFVILAVTFNSGSNSIFIGNIPIEGIGILNPAITFTYLLCIRLLFSALKQEEDNSQGISWLFESLPSDKINFISGAKKFIIIFFIVPLTVLSLILLSLKAPLEIVLLNYAYIISGTFLINSLFRKRENYFPFSKSINRLTSVNRFAEIFISILSASILFVLQYFIFTDIKYVFICILSFCILSLFISKLNIKRWAKKTDL